MKNLLTLFLTLSSSFLFSQFDEGIIIDTLHNATAEQVSDFDGDGDQDLVILQYDQLVWFENLGGGTISEQQIIFADFEGWHNLQIVDMNGDALDDLFMNYNNIGDPIGKISWFENNGDGTYTEQVIISSKVDHAFVRDFDGDGDIDLFYTLATDIVWRENDGSGVFGAEEVLIDGSEYTQLFHLFDIDGDGDDDMIHFETGESTTYFNENLGDGTFGAREFMFNFVSMKQFESVDVDNDGDQDILCVYDYDVRLIENIDGVLGVPTLILTVGTSNFFSLGDLNGDGLTDLLTEAGPAYLRYSMNLGDGTFEDPVFFDNPEPDCECESGELDGITYKVAADLDADGDLEVYADVSFDYSYLMLYDNTTASDYEVSGIIYVDENENGVRDIDEPSAGFANVGSTPEEEFAFTNPDGEFTSRYTYDHGAAYDIAPILPAFWGITSDPEFYSIIIDSTLYYDTLDFGIYPTELVDSIENVLVGARAKCNTIVNYWVSVNNEGSTVPSGLIHLELDDSLTYIGAEIAPDSISDQHIYWHYDDLAWFSEHIFSVQVEIPNYLSDGDTIVSILSSSIEGSDFENHDSLFQVVTCAYDPNDKVAAPMGMDEPGYIGMNTEFIEYTVRFQNTGSDTATNVRIIDQLDPNINWTSIVPLASSHDMSLSYDMDGEVTFVFDNIMLPDSNVNELASHGFVHYRVQLLEDLFPGTVISNSAEIYFDSNPAVVTNTTLNTLFDCESVIPFITISEPVCFGDVTNGSLSGGVWPSNSTFTWATDAGVFEGEDINIFFTEPGSKDIIVTFATDFCSVTESYTILMPETIEEEQPTLFVCDGDSVLVYGDYQSEAGIYIDTLTTITGCDSVLITNLVVNPTYETELPELFICEGDSALIFGDYQLESGIYELVLETITGCDSVEFVNLIVNPTYFEESVVSICSGDSALIFGNYQSTAGLYTDSHTTVKGCDSTYTVTLIINENPTVTFEEIEDDIICAESAAIDLYGTPSGGVFSGTGVEGTIFNPVISGEGDFTLVYTYSDENDCEAEDELLISVVDCLTLTENNADIVTIAPNPFDDFTSIEFANDPVGTQSIVIYDLLGQEVYRMNNLSGATHVIQKSDIGTGVFMLNILNVNGQLLINTKLIVK